MISFNVTVSRCELNTSLEPNLFSVSARYLVNVETNLFKLINIFLYSILLGSFVFILFLATVVDLYQVIYKNIYNRPIDNGN